jgi:N-acetylglucosamine kinase-like BadF-type ATPase
MADDKERARMEIEDAVYRALEAGMTAQEIKAEVDYALESADDA